MPIDTHRSFNVLQNSQDEGASITTDDNDHEVVLQIHDYLFIYYYTLL